MSNQPNGLNSRETELLRKHPVAALLEFKCKSLKKQYLFALWLVLPTLFVCGIPSVVHAKSLAHDTFDIDAGTVGQADSGTGWGGPWHDHLNTETGQLAGRSTLQIRRHPGGSQKKIAWISTSPQAGHIQRAARALGHDISFTPGAVVYISALIYRPAGANLNKGESMQIVLRNREDTAHHSPISVGFGIGSPENLFVEVSGAKPTTKSTKPGAVRLGQAYRVIERIRCGSGQDVNKDQVSLMMLPATAGIPDSAPAPSSSAWNVTLTSNLLHKADTLQITTGPNASWQIADLRIGNTWSDVTSPISKLPSAQTQTPATIASGLPKHEIVKDGQPKLIFTEGKQWTQGRGYLECSGPGNSLQAKYEVGPGDCVIRIRLSVDHLANSGAAFGINERSWIGAQNGEVWGEGDIFGRPAKRISIPELSLSDGKPFDVVIARHDERVRVWVNGKQVYQFHYARPDFGLVSVRPWRSTMRVYDFSVAGNLIIPKFQYDQSRILSYGDPNTIAPMLGPCVTYDWDRDGKKDLVFRGSWWRNTGQKVDGRTVFARTQTPAIPLPDERAMFGNIADINQNGYDDAVWGTTNAFVLTEDTTTHGTRHFVEKSKLKSVLGLHKITREDTVPTPVWEKISYGKVLLPAETVEEFRPDTWIVDWDGDGLTDLLECSLASGVNRAVPFDQCDHDWGWKGDTWLFRDTVAQIWFHRNVGTKQHPVFTAGALVRAGTGQRALSFMDWAIPMAVDWNNDGKTDLLVGTFDQMILYLNTGASKGVPQLDNGHLLTFNGLDELPVERREFFPFKDKRGLWHIRFDMGECSEAVQLDKRDPFAFGPWRHTLFKNPVMRIDFHSVPEPADWDGDGKIDLLVGAQDGYLWYYHNIDPTGGPNRWAPVRPIKVDGKPLRIQHTNDLQGPLEDRWGYTMPAVIDWDGDGDLDLILGNASESYLYYENVGTRTKPDLQPRGPLMVGNPGHTATPIDCAWRSRPAVGDMDGDGLPDIVGADGKGYLCWWRRYRDKSGHLCLAAPQRPVDAKGKAFIVTGIGRLNGRSILEAVDLEHRGMLDLICSPPLDPRNRRGYQLFFHNEGLHDGQLVLTPRPHELRLLRTIGSFSHFFMAQPVDFNHDGKWEMVAGIDDGYLYYWPK